MGLIGADLSRFIVIKSRSAFIGHDRRNCLDIKFWVPQLRTQRHR
jgi:hypothetical protein